MSWTDNGAPILWNPDIAECVALYAELKTHDRCASGGPLHIITDDANLDDCWLEVEPDRYNKRVWGGHGVGWRTLDEIEWPPEVIRICDRILELLRDMSEPQRYAVNAYHWGYAQKYILERAKELGS